MRHDNDIKIEELINSLEHFSIDLKNQKDIAEIQGNSYKNIAMKYTMKQIKGIVDKLDKLIIT